MAERSKIMQRSHDAVNFINRTVCSPEKAEQLKLAAFMDIFHPEVPPMAPYQIKEALWRDPPSVKGKSRTKTRRTTRTSRSTTSK